MVLSEARAALARCDWDAAHRALTRAGCADPVEEADRLELLADALWWLGRLEECIEARQDAYARLDERGLTRRAGQAAIWCYEHHSFMGRPAIGQGWLRRARRALEGDTGCVEWGNLLLREAETAHGRGDLGSALDKATSALDLGRRLRSADLEAEALQTIGRLLIDNGRPDDGMAHLDEAMLLAVEGRLGPYATGKVYCSLIGACEDLGDLRRAAEWTEATTNWAQRHPFAVFPGLCRLKRAGTLRWRGDWDEAEREARQACEELATIKLGSAAAAWVEVGEIRRRIGDLDGAEAAFARAQDSSCSAAGGLALLRLAQGHVADARSIVDDALRDAPWNLLYRARLLPAQVEIALAANDVDAARAAADELAAITRRYQTPVLVASALVARGRVDLAAGDPDAAQSKLRRAVDEWQELDVPYETATAQLLLAHASDASGDQVGAARLAAAASATFDRLGASYDARHIASMPRHGSLPCGLSEREAEVLRLVARGLTNKEIAVGLSLSQKTIARHLSNIFVKTGSTSRTAAAAFAFENGIVGHRHTAS